MASNIVRACDINVADISFGEVRTLDNGGKMVNISYNNHKLLMQLPNLTASYGLNVWPSDRPGAFDKMHLDLSLVGYDSNPAMKSFFEKMMAFDDKLIDTAMSNSKTWLRKTVASREVIQAVFTPLVKFSKDKLTGELSTQWPPVVRLQIPRTKTGAVDVEVYDAGRERLDFDSVEFKRAQVTAIVQVTSVWIISGKFGVSMKVQQMKVAQNATNLNKYAFIEDPDEVTHDSIDA
jgi:hypothetical protein